MDGIKKLSITANKINLSNTLTQIIYTKFNDTLQDNLCKKNKIDQCRNEKSACKCGLLV